MYEILLII